MSEDEKAFTAFVEEVEPRLRRAFTLLRGHDDGRDATAEALAWAWANWDSVRHMHNAAGYLYRVGASRTRRRPIRFAELSLSQKPSPTAERHFEPELLPALGQLSERQRHVVVLIHGCGWTHQEVADALELSRSSVGTHVERAMNHLRNELGVDRHG